MKFIKTLKSVMLTMVTLAGISIAMPVYATCSLAVSQPVTGDTPQAKEFLDTCNNPYTATFANDAVAANAGKRKYGFNSCGGCHGKNGEGVMAPSLASGQWKSAKNSTDKGMFETIADGSGAHKMNYLSENGVDGLLKLVAYVRTLNKNPAVTTAAPVVSQSNPSTRETISTSNSTNTNNAQAPSQTRESTQVSTINNDSSANEEPVDGAFTSFKKSNKGKSKKRK